MTAHVHGLGNLLSSAEKAIATEEKKLIGAVAKEAPKLLNTATDAFSKTDFGKQIQAKLDELDTKIMVAKVAVATYGILTLGGLAFNIYLTSKLLKKR